MTSSGVIFGTPTDASALPKYASAHFGSAFSTLVYLETAASKSPFAIASCASMRSFSMPAILTHPPLNLEGEASILAGSIKHSHYGIGLENVLGSWIFLDDTRVWWRGSCARGRKLFYR